jgi:hypothetical protein
MLCIIVTIVVFTIQYLHTYTGGSSYPALPRDHLLALYHSEAVAEHGRPLRVFSSFSYLPLDHTSVAGLQSCPLFSP